MSGEFRTFVLFFNGGVHWKGFGLSVAEGGLQPALYFFYKGPLYYPRPFGGVRYNDYLYGLIENDMKNFLTALFVGYVVVGVYKAVTKKG